MGAIHLIKMDGQVPGSIFLVFSRCSDKNSIVRWVGSLEGGVGIGRRVFGKLHAVFASRRVQELIGANGTSSRRFDAVWARVRTDPSAPMFEPRCFLTLRFWFSSNYEAVIMARKLQSSHYSNPVERCLGKRFVQCKAWLTVQ